MHDRARAILNDLHSREDSQYISPLWLAWLHLGLGENEHALDMLAQATLLTCWPRPSRRGLPT